MPMSTLPITEKTNTSIPVNTLLQYIVEDDACSVFNLLLNNGTIPSSITTNINKLYEECNNSTLLHHACRYRSINIARYLIEELGASTIIYDKSLCTKISDPSPLMSAIYTDNLEFVQLILENGCNDINLTNKSGDNPLMVALSDMYNADILYELLKYKNININYQNDKTISDTALHNAIKYSKEIAKKKYNTEVSVKEIDYLCKSICMEIGEYDLHPVQNTVIKANKFGCTPIDYAVQHKLKETCKYLLTLPCNAENRYKCTDEELNKLID